MRLLNFLIGLPLLLAGCVERADPSPTPSDSAASPERATPGEPPAGSEQIHRVGGDIVAPRKISGDRPDITALAQARRIRGVTIFQVVVTKEGRAENLEFLKLGAPEFAEPIKKAVKTWRFEPATLHGKPVAVYFTMTLHIRLQ